MKSVVTFALFSSILVLASAAPATIAVYRIEGVNAADIAAMTPERIKAEGKADWSVTSELPIGSEVSNQFVSSDLKANVSLQAAQTRSSSGALAISVRIDVKVRFKQSTENLFDGMQGQLTLVVKPGQSVIFSRTANNANVDANGKSTTSSAMFCVLTLGESKL